MKLWIIKPKQNIPWEAYEWFLHESRNIYIVRAETEKEARELIRKFRENNRKWIVIGDNLWLRPQYSSCEELTIDGIPEIIN